MLSTAEPPVGPRLAALQKRRQKFAQLQRRQLRSRAVWQHMVGQELLPSLAWAATSASEAGDSHPAESADTMPAESIQVDCARALALRACANPGCTNVRGASEARVHGRLCAGCGVVRYCSDRCQLTDWTAHGCVCALLAAKRE